MFRGLLGSLLDPSSGKENFNRLDEDQEDFDLPVDTELDKNPLYAECQTVLERSRTLFDLHDQLNECIASIEPLPNLAEQWEKDYAEVQRLIEAGREATEMEVERLVMFDTKRDGGLHGARNRWRKRKRALEKDENLQLMLEMGKAEVKKREARGKKGNKRTCGWGATARKIERGVKVLASALPEEVESKKRRRTY